MFFLVKMTRRYQERIRQFLNSSKLTPQQRQTLKRFNNELKALGRRASTRRNYVWTLHDLGSFTRKPYKQITRGDITAFINGMENDATRELRKVLVKRFYRWLYDMKKGHYPPQVDWVVIRNVKTKVTKDQLLTPEELKEVIRHAENSRDKAFISTSWEAGDRPGEHLSLKVGSVETTDFGFILHIQISKTETRSLPIHQTARYLARWLNDHPFRDDPRAPLWISLSKKSFGQPLGYSGAYRLVKRAKRRAGVDKPLSSKWLRHGRLTDLAKKVREPQLKRFAGWTPDSRMVGVYVHLSGMDTVEPVLEAEGVKPQESVKPWIEPLTCSRCETLNDATAMYCDRCGAPLTEEVTITQTEEIRKLREEYEHRIHGLESRLVGIDTILKKMTDLEEQMKREKVRSK